MRNSIGWPHHIAMALDVVLKINLNNKQFIAKLFQGDVCIINSRKISFVPELSNNTSWISPEWFSCKPNFRRLCENDRGVRRAKLLLGYPSIASPVIMCRLIVLVWHYILCMSYLCYLGMWKVFITWNS